MNNSLLFEGPEKINQKLKPILHEMTKSGMLIDREKLDDLSLRIDNEISDLEKEAYSALGYEFNLNSPKQLAQILFEELKLPPTKKIKTGYSTDEQSLRKIESLHPLVPIMLSYREIFKIKSTYIDGLMRYLDKKNRVHSKFRADNTATGRLTSSDPNLQNIPVRGTWSKDLREIFVSTPGYLFLSADYSQFEFRILAHFSGDAKLLAAFSTGVDIHRATASEIFGKRPDEVTPEERRVAKTVNFGIIYGISAHGLSEELEIDFEEADRFIHEYFNSYGGVRFYLENLLKEAESKGYIETLGGFRREIPELKSENTVVRRAGERMAVNFPFQGTAAEIIKIAMIEVFGELKKRNLKSRIVLQIHDELLLEVSKSEMNEVCEMVKERMEDVVKLSCPLKVDLSVGDNWAGLEELDGKKQVDLGFKIMEKK